MTESLFQKYEQNKAASFKQNENLNQLLGELKSLLTPIQQEKQRSFDKPEYPVAFIVGCPRSGTTLIHQWMAYMGVFSYPSNFLTRFAYAPYIGALIQQMLFNPDFDFHGDFEDIHSELNFSSDLGKSKGALATNEFQHFFRNYMPNFDPEYLSDEEVNKVDFDGIKKGIASIEAVFDKPFVTKAMMLQYNISQLKKHFPDALFLFVKRYPLLNMQSILKAREKYYGDQNIWWSVKPKEYNQLKTMDLYHQIAGQVFYTNQFIEKELRDIPEKQKITINYKEFCGNPGNTYFAIQQALSQLSCELAETYPGQSGFTPNTTLTISKEEIGKFEEAFNSFATNNQGMQE